MYDNRLQEANMTKFWLLQMRRMMPMQTLTKRWGFLGPDFCHVMQANHFLTQKSVRQKSPEVSVLHKVSNESHPQPQALGECPSMPSQTCIQLVPILLYNPDVKIRGCVLGGGEGVLFLSLDYKTSSNHSFKHPLHTHMHTQASSPLLSKLTFHWDNSHCFQHKP